MELQPIGPRESAVDACGRVLREALLRGDLEPGSRLPPERELAQQLAVGRATLRGALARLAADGLLQVRQGSGYLVRDFRAAGGPDLLVGLSELANAKDRLAIVRDLLRVRRHLAQAVLERIVEMKRVSTLAIADCVDRFEAVAVAGGSVEAIADCDLAVVSALVAATESPALQLCFNPVQQVVMTMPQLRRLIYADPMANVAGYRALLGWLEVRDAEGAAAMAEQLALRDADTLRRLELQTKRAS